MNHSDMAKEFYKQEIMVKEQERRLHGIVAELVAVKKVLNDTASFLTIVYGMDAILGELHVRRVYLDKVIDELLQPIDVSGWDKHEGENLEIEGAEMSAKGENL